MKRAVLAVAVLTAIAVVGMSSLLAFSPTWSVAYREAGGGGYEADITARPVATTSECDIKFMIHDRSKDSLFCKAVTEYGIRLVDGVTANVSVGDDNNGCFLTAAVHQASGKVTVDKVAVIRRNGVVVMRQEISEPLSH
ncbi:MAG: hypothetical protein ACKOUR_14175 [Planctomycetota bacterium]